MNFINMITTGKDDMSELTLTEEQCLITTDGLSKLLGVAKRTVLRLKNSGKLPMPVRIGRSFRWRYNEIMSWIDNDCPPLAVWNEINS